MPKRIVVCSDGTWSHELDPTPTNVVKIERALKHDDAQRVWYDRGVGTGGFWDRQFGGATGWGISKNLMEAYLFLARNYEPGDDIYLFGFSRGAYTVRSTAGMIRKCGLLKRRFANWAGIIPAFLIYRKRDGTADTWLARQFRRRFSHHPVRIKFIGVWDTVGALGIPVKPLNALTRWATQFHDVKLSRSVEYAYQAVAIDEKRQVFTPTLWEQDANPPPEQKEMRQVWFAGCHSDVGGGNDDSGLSDVALMWLIQRAQSAGLSFAPERIAALTPDALGEIHESLSGPWLALGIHIRRIGVATRSNEHVDESVKERYTRLTDYRPENLVDYDNRNPLWP